MLKKRFRQLQRGIDIVDMREIEKLVLACCMVHNKCIRAGDDEDFEDVVLNAPPPNPPHMPINDEAEGQMKRIIITNNLCYA